MKKQLDGGPLEIDVSRSEIYDRHHKPSHSVDGWDPNRSNWMRYVNCSRNAAEQNLIAFQYQGQIYYRTIKLVPRYTELLIFYGSEFALGLGINLRGYHVTACGNTDSKRNPKDLYESVDDVTDHSTDTSINVSNIIDFDDNEATSATKNEQNMGADPHDTNDADEIVSREETFQGQFPDNDHLYAVNTENNSDFIRYQYESRDVDFENENTDIDDICVETPQDLTNNIKEKEASLTETLEPLNNARTNTRIKAFDCTLCDYKSATNYLLKIHTRRHNGDKPHKCDICEYAGVTKYELKRHYRMHTDEKPCCTIGEPSFLRNTNLNKHTTHSKEQKKKSCQCCGASFASNSGLKRHAKIHTGEKNYQCHLCSYKCIENFHLTRHMKTHRKLE